jgi:5,10-methenyltetrahydrofolate synthetase
VDKESVRRETLHKLSLLSNEQILSFSFALTNQIIKFFHSFPELTGHIGAAYLPLRTEIAPVYQELLHKLALNIAFPILVEGEMRFGIPQGMPRGGTWLDPPYVVVDPSWIMVPGVAFDLKGGRVGRGKGYYDRYLEPSSSLRLGLAWSEQILERVPVESHDCHMDYLITEKFCWDVTQQKRF